MLRRKLNSPQTSSVGRLFDAVASLINLRQQMRFEGQAAMELEFALDGIETDESYNLSPVTRHSSLVLDWSPMIEAILSDVQKRRCRWQDFSEVSQRAGRSRGGRGKKIRRAARGVERRLFSKPLFDRADGAAVAGGKFSAILASARAAERRRHCAGADCGGAACGQIADRKS